MAYIDKRQRGCINCKDRRIKCDGIQPICLKCIRSNRQCQWNLEDTSSISALTSSFEVSLEGTLDEIRQSTTTSGIYQELDSGVTQSLITVPSTLNSDHSQGSSYSNSNVTYKDPDSFPVFRKCCRCGLYVGVAKEMRRACYDLSCRHEYCSHCPFQNIKQIRKKDVRVYKWDGIFHSPRISSIRARVKPKRPSLLLTKPILLFASNHWQIFRFGVTFNNKVVNLNLAIEPGIYIAVDIFEKAKVSVHLLKFLCTSGRPKQNQSHLTTLRVQYVRVIDYGSTTAYLPTTNKEFRQRLGKGFVRFLVLWSNVDVALDFSCLIHLDGSKYKFVREVNANKNQTGGGTLGNSLLRKRSMKTQRLRWICVCGKSSFDDYLEYESGSVQEFANNLMKAGYITYASVSGEARGTFFTFGSKFANFIVGLQNKLSSLKSPKLPLFTSPQAAKQNTPQCIPPSKCRWIHLCLKKRPYATKLEPLHFCKASNQEKYNDRGFFRELRSTYNKQTSCTEKLLYKLSKIQFVEFDLCPENLVDRIQPDKLPPSLDEYDFIPAPPPKKCPPIGPSQMMHLFSECASIPPSTTFFLNQIPKKKNSALNFNPQALDAQTGWGLHFVENINSSLAVTILFIVSLITGLAFATCWIILKKDIQGAFGVASYVTSIVTLGVMAWQMSSV